MDSAPAPYQPVSTYRLQLSQAFPLAEAARLVPYLAALGITTCYTSPILAAKPGSPHGYDTCDHSRVNQELGGDEGLAALSAALQQHGLGLLVDFVPNHMSIDPVANRWWRSVLENGPSSEFARYFDIDWHPVKVELKGKVLLPVLGDQYGVALDQGQLQVVCADGQFSLRCFDLDLPLDLRELRLLLRHRLDALQGAADAADPGLNELLSILFQLDHMPPSSSTSPEAIALRGREKEIARQRLVRLLDEHPLMKAHLDENVRLFNGVPGDPHSFDLLHEMLELQPYRLSFWRTAMHEINYRRFFDINDLAGIRVEEASVFTDAHVRIAALAASGVLQGLRLDHIDGLFDPTGYLERLASLLAPAAPYVVVEKILSRDEPLPEHWRTRGTTGYEFMNDVSGVLVDGARAHVFHTIYSRFTGDPTSIDDVIYESKRLVIATSMSSELNVLAHWLNRISEQRRDFRDFTLESLRDALREVVACFPVYRTYFGYDGWSPRDERIVDAAIAAALERNPATEPSIFAFVRSMLLPARTADLTEDEYKQRRRFAMKFQQYTGPVQAKGVEDTAFYRYTPLLSINEVGGEPERFGRSVEEFHAANLGRLRDRPLAMTATATHDSKRGEDARARINVLSEIPAEWRTIVSRWSRANRLARSEVNGAPAPDRRDEYLFYQALIGAWPAGLDRPPDEAFVERMRSYMQKAVKEAKVHTSWIRPSPAYDAAVASFVEQVLTGRTSGAFLRTFLPLASRLARLGAVNSLAQLVLKIASPGAPDFYQGTELWDLSLVDPDNRRPVDFASRQRVLAEATSWLGNPDPSARIATLADLLANWEDGRIKLHLMLAGLRLRRSRPDLFLRGDYLPLEADGERSPHLVACARRAGDEAVVALVPRLPAAVFGSQAPAPPAPDAWRDLAVTLPPQLAGLSYRHVFTGEPVELDPGRDGTSTLRVADALGHVPVALLHGRRPGLPDEPAT